MRLPLRRIAVFSVLALTCVALVLQAQSRRGRTGDDDKGMRWEIMRPVVRGKRAAISAGTPLVTEAAMRMYHRGGNAVDAGVASLFAGSVSEFSHFGFGGEAPILIRAADGKVYSIAGVGTSPKLMTREFFLTRRTEPEDEQEAQRQDDKQGPIPSYGMLPALVPGMVDAGLLALREFGTKSFEEIAQPAIELADGFPLDDTRAGSIARAGRFLKRFPTSQRVFAPAGRTLRPGDMFHQPDLARTIRAMAAVEQAALAKGASRKAAIDAIRDYFYRGEIARKIGKFSAENDGLLRYEDMAAFRLDLEEPLSTAYRGYEVHKGGFWTQGGTMIEALNILEGYDLRSMGWNSPKYIHTIVEALKLAYADRDTYFADPRFAKIPPELMTKEYAAERRKLINPIIANPNFRPGEFGSGQAPHPSLHAGRLRPLTDALASRDTTCIDTIDQSGMMFSATPSGAWMPSVIAGDTGIPLTQRAQSFLMMASHPNVVAPGKRPRVTLTPTIVTKGGAPFMALSTPGGDQQEQALLQVMLAALEFGMNAQAAVEAPRFQTRHFVSSFDDHAMTPNSLLLDERIPAEVLLELQTRGHDIEQRSRWASGSAPVAVRVLPNSVIEAGADPYGYRYADGW